VQWLGVVEKITTFPRFSEVSKEHLVTTETKFLRRLKGERLRFLELKSSKFLKETDKRAHTTVDVKQLDYSLSIFMRRQLMRPKAS